MAKWIKKSKHVEATNDFENYVIEISPKFNFVNKIVGANLAIMKRNEDGTLTILKLLSHYKMYRDAKKDIKKQAEMPQKTKNED